jgi:hypothetical protein
LTWTATWTGTVLALTLGFQHLRRHRGDALELSDAEVVFVKAGYVPVHVAVHLEVHVHVNVNAPVSRGIT